MRRWWCAVAALALAACGGNGNEDLEREARALAIEFHGAARDGDTTRLLSLVDYPFNFDNQVTVKTPERMQELLKEKHGDVHRVVLPATKMEFAAYDDFLAGAEIAKKSVEGEAARRQAEKLSFREGGILVRCFHEKEGRQDGRAYYLVMHRNSLGVLKITTYYD